MTTYRQCNPYVQLCVFLFEDTDDFISFGKLIKIKLDNLNDKSYKINVIVLQLCGHGYV